MKDKDGFNIQCEFSDWEIIDEDWNHDFVCRKYFTGGKHYCYANEHCKDYKPIEKKGNRE